MRTVYIIISCLLVLLPGKAGTISPISNYLAADLRTGTYSITNFNGSINVNISYSSAFPASNVPQCSTGINGFQQTLPANGYVFAQIYHASCQLSYITLQVASSNLIITRLKGSFIASNLNSFNGSALRIAENFFACGCNYNLPLPLTQPQGTKHPVLKTGGWNYVYIFNTVGLLNTTTQQLSLKVILNTNSTYITDISIGSYITANTLLSTVIFTLIYFANIVNSVIGEPMVWIHTYTYV